ncbi:hypothetical protein DSM104443_00770 [Usitatibacter rugosus]|uniref:Uncharacterized protein n=1 Tax=Usitatibacter rugosus TaxID=2732067 RepID=A0A6M4GQU2_9PROT|nr:hypothetical protein [Usitatibacter rugosus]QJR09720.1 hypothetical protein DSM104443_00770 [Usitatibacter rugosus]
MKPMAFAAAAVLAACVPLLPHDYLEPSAPGATTIVNRCWGMRDQVEMDLGPVKAFARVARFPPSLRFVELRLQVPPGHVIVPDGDEATLTGASGSERRRVVLGTTSNPTLPTEPLRAMEGGRVAGGFDRNHWLFIPIEGDGEIEVRFPAMSLDGKPFPLPPIRFTPRSHVQVAAPLQC